MLGNLKDLYQLQSQAREIQKKLEQETVEAESNGVKIIMNGNQKVLSVSLNSELSKEEQQEHLVQAFNDAVKKVQQLMTSSLVSS